MYHKFKLVEALHMRGIKRLKNVIKLSKCSTKTLRKIENNTMVITAVKKLGENCKDALSVALVLYDISTMENFYQNSLKKYIPEGFQGRDVRNWGYLCWAQVEEFVKRYNLRETLNTFE